LARQFLAREGLRLDTITGLEALGLNRNAVLTSLRIETGRKGGDHETTYESANYSNIHVCRDGDAV
jgi:hypothetical protein